MKRNDGDCRDHAVAESFFSSPKKEQSIRRFTEFANLRQGSKQKRLGVGQNESDGFAQPVLRHSAKPKPGSPFEES
jgi:hypothetical protein